MTDNHPASIGPYRVLRPLARGGMAAVYEVEDPETGQRVALKLLTQRGMARPRFQREYRALTRLDHPHIVRVYRFGIDDNGRPYLTMELLDGVPAQVHAKRLGRPGTPSRTTDVIRIVKEVASALGYLHDRGIVHRDLKSSNVMVLASGAARLLDFGTARWLVTDEQLTRHGEFVGTFAYAPPEQLTGKPVDARSDLYALGVLMYRLLTGKRPFEASSPQELAKLHLEHTPPAPGVLVSGVPAPVSDLTMRLLSKDPEDRPSSAWIVRDRLEQAMASGARAPRDAHNRPPELLGRHQEVQSLDRFLQRRAPGSLLVVTGPAGSGRERFLQHAREHAVSLQIAVVEAAFSSGPSITTLGDLGREASAGHALVPAITDALHAASTAATQAAQPGGRAALGEALARLLAARAQLAGGPLVVLLRAIHRADAVAVDTLLAIRDALAQSQAPVLLAASSTTPALSPSPMMLRVLKPTEIIAVGPVSKATMARLVSSVLGRRPPPPGLPLLIHEACGGMPGHAVAVTNAMIRKGLLASTEDEDGRRSWIDCSGGRVAIPSRIADNLTLRLDALDPQPRRVLEALAVAGLAMSVGPLAAACELDPPQVDDALEQLAQAGLVHPDSDTPPRWAPLLGMTRQLLRESLRKSRRRVLRGQLARALRDEPPTAAKLRLLLDAGDRERALQDGVAWARQELSRTEAPTIVPLLQRVASACAADDTLPVDQRAHLLALVGRASTRADATDPRGARALDAAEQLGVPEVLATIDIERAARHRNTGDTARAVEAIARARQRLERYPSQALAARVAVEEARLREAAGENQQALACWRAVERASPEGPARARGRIGAARCMAATGQLRAAHSEAEAAWMDRRRAGDLVGERGCALQLSRLLRLQARFSEALRLVEPLLDPTRAAGTSLSLGSVLLELAEIRMDLLRLGEVRDLLAEARTLQASQAHPRLRAELAFAHARLALLSDAPERAVTQVQHALSAARGAGLRCAAEELRAALGEALVASGNRDVGEQALRNAIAGLSAMQNLPALARAITAQQRVAPPSSDPTPRWRPLARWLEREPARAFAFERALAQRAYALHCEHRDLLTAAEQQATLQFAEIQKLQDPLDRAALRVHPWHRRLQGTANTSPHQ